MDRADFDHDTLGDAQGKLYATMLEPLGGDRVRLSVVPTTIDNNEER
ncbi:hypothetical protein [Nocardia sp. NPDC127526]